MSGSMTQGTSTDETRYVAATLELAPHLRRGAARVGGAEQRRLFGRPGRIAPDFMSKLLERPFGYDPELAYVLAVVAGWAYSDAATLARQLKYYGLTNARIEEISVRNPALYVIATGYFIRSDCGRVGMLAFRGTEPVNLVNWLTDTDVNQRRFGAAGSVHQGFYNNLQSIWEDIENALQQGAKAAPHGGNGSPALPPLERLFVTGHSLGGAMAVLAAAKLCSERHPLASVLRGVYTFGQPAVGDAAFAECARKQFGDRLFRHEYRRDAVPRLPPSSTGTFRHFGTLRVARHAGQGWAASGADGAQSALVVSVVLSVLASFVGRRFPAFARLEAALCKYSLFDDHSPAAYIAASRSSLDGAQNATTAKGE